jgi:hypothetical protein
MKTYEIERYSAKHPDWEGSFSERLYEYCEWNQDEFWKLHEELTEVAKGYRELLHFPKELMGRILGIQRSIYSIMIAHYNENDVVKLTGITEDKFEQFIQRFEDVMIGLHTGIIYDESNYKLKNPLIEKN